MDIGFGYKIIRRTRGYDLYVPTMNIDPKTEEMKAGFRVYHYGVLYSALIGFLRESLEEPKDLDALRERVQAIVQQLRDLEKQLKDEFSVEVLVSKP